MQSVEVPAGSLSRVLREATSFIKHLEDAIPGHGWSFVINTLVGDP